MWGMRSGRKASPNFSLGRSMDPTSRVNNFTTSTARFSLDPSLSATALIGKSAWSNVHTSATKKPDQPPCASNPFRNRILLKKHLGYPAGLEKVKRS